MYNILYILNRTCIILYGWLYGMHLKNILRLISCKILHAELNDDDEVDAEAPQILHQILSFA